MPENNNEATLSAWDQAMAGFFPPGVPTEVVLAEYWAARRRAARAAREAARKPMRSLDHPEEQDDPLGEPTD